MPVADLFVDSDSGGCGDQDDFTDGEDSDNGDGGGGSDNLDDSNANGSEVRLGDDNDSKAKKRKNPDKKKELRKSKKLKKLGPKESKKKEEKLTSEEIKELKLTAKEYEQFSNLYNVQIEEVLRETEIPEKRKQEATNWVEDFKKFIIGLGPSKKFLVKDHAKILSPVRLPFPPYLFSGVSEGEDDPRWEWMKTKTLQWLPPSQVEIRGAWKTGTALNKVSPLDVFLEMPYDYLVKSDTLNHKYHLKRAIYLGFVAKKMEKRGEVLKFTLENGETLKPVISTHVKGVQILIHAVPPQEYFPILKLACDKNNLRHEHLFGKAKLDDGNN